MSLLAQLLGPIFISVRSHSVRRADRDQKMIVVPGNSTTGLVSSRYLRFGDSQIPREHRQFAFPPVLPGTPSRLTASALLGSLLRSVRPPGTDTESTSNAPSGQRAPDLHICALTCTSVDTRKSDKTVRRSYEIDAGTLVAQMEMCTR